LLHKLVHKLGPKVLRAFYTLHLRYFLQGCCSISLHDWSPTFRDSMFVRFLMAACVE